MLITTIQETIFTIACRNKKYQGGMPSLWWKRQYQNVDETGLPLCQEDNPKWEIQMCVVWVTICDHHEFWELRNNQWGRNDIKISWKCCHCYSKQNKQIYNIENHKKTNSSLNFVLIFLNAEQILIPHAIKLAYFQLYVTQEFI